MSLVPKLRFKQDDGSDFPEWEDKKLGDVAPLQRGFDLPIQNFIQGIYPVVYSNGILRYHNTFKVKNPGVVTGRSGTIGQVTYVNQDYWPHNTSLWVTSFKGNNPKFIYYLYIQINLDKLSSGSGVPTLNRNDIHIKIKKIPSIQEQEKIAGFLTAVDELIADLTKKESLLQKYKKGVMQKIFSQELRFKQDDGSDYPDWTTTTIKSISTHKSSNISLDSLKNNVGNYNLYGASGLVKKINFFTEFDDYLAIVKDGSGVGRIFYCEKNSSVLGTMSIIKASNQVDLKYLYYVLSNVSFKFCIIGSSIPHIYYKDYSQQKIQNPSLPEQQKIANFLSSIDDQISIVQQQLDKTKRYKKALLQQLFI